MDAEQIQQDMRARRAAIDARLDQITQQAAVARRRTVPALVAIVSALVAVKMWLRWRAHRKELPEGRRAPRLLTAG
jgi:hypothetical protein